MITTIGLALNILALVVCVWLDPEARGIAPSWVALFVCVCHFLYVLMDNTDGKQAGQLPHLPVFVTNHP